MFDRSQSQPNDFEVAMEHRKARVRQDYLRESGSCVEGIDILVCRPQLNLRNGIASVDAEKTPNYITEAAIYICVQKDTSSGYATYEPAIFTTSGSIRQDDRAEIAFAGYVLSKHQGAEPLRGKVILADASQVSVRLSDGISRLLPKIKLLEQWLITPPEPPVVVINKHCPYCEFQHACMRVAEKDDSISQLGRISEKELRRLEKKGIFTIKQLSYLYRPRKKNRRGKTSPIVHKYELQALALRTGNIYLQGDAVPIPRTDSEIYLDIESDPDRRFHYLIGILLIEHGVLRRLQFWADHEEDERTIWGEFVTLIGRYPGCPIYHYGRFERSVIEQLGKAYETDAEPILQRLFNINSCIYGRVYLPVRSNGLKDICQFLGFSWTSSNASGLQSIAWRYWYDVSGNQDYRQLLLTYNYEDCENLRFLVEKLRDIATNATRSPEIRFADVEGGSTTERAADIVNRFNALLKSAHGSYEQSKIILKKKPKIARGSQEGKSSKSQVNHTERRVHKVVRVRRGITCPRHPGRALKWKESEATRTIIDLVFTANGIKKVVTKYIGKQGFCTACHSLWNPPAIRRLGTVQDYGHGLQAWLTYHRMALCLPFSKIAQLFEEMFSERINSSQVCSLIEQLSRYYVPTEKLLLKKILASPIIHADETTINILGTSQYVWVITDGSHVVFRHTEGRDAKVMHELLDGYTGVLCSDFYSGYDSVNCAQQKCWAHLIRDLNDDLRKSPFDAELEIFVSAVRDLIVPIFEAIEKYGLKKRNLHKFKKDVDRFYDQQIDNKQYRSSLMNTYQKRFSKYRDKLFVFIERDGVPWNNNMAERALRHIAVQRKISGSFGKYGILRYLLLLGVTQSCRFQKNRCYSFCFLENKTLPFSKAKARLLVGVCINLPD
ncbi:MAG: IS66 family transposase [Nitrosomonas sp.]|uniref:IS66 family transposase n=1 Tax=Nitrosomonas sp. TaxID=42353 RepID=UPI002736C149|nr:IS66 family transposase [Nitrosomonas sp.]MDP3282513.1 IS66 family transposase [Nitrosomonas sp.]